MTYSVISAGSPRHRKRIAMFDFDHTLVKPKSGGTFPKDADDWQWLRPSVPVVVKEWYAKGFAIIVFTNQSKAWKVDMIQSVLRALEVPCTAAIALDKVAYKPSRTIFDAVVKKEWDASASFFVGDALGRANDFADSDLQFGHAIGVRVLSPEEAFPFEERVPADTLVKPAAHQEVVVMVGYPGSGKSTLAEKVFGSNGYVVLAGDVLKTHAKMMHASIEALMKQKSIVIDATNANREKRAEFIGLAKDFGVPARCIHMNISLEEALARNYKRAAEGAEAGVVPKMAFFAYRKRFQEPHPCEGCEVVTL